MWWTRRVLQNVCAFEEARSETQTLDIGVSNLGLKSLFFWGGLVRNTEKSSCGVAALASRKAGYREKLDIKEFPIRRGANKLDLCTLV